MSTFRCAIAGCGEGADVVYRGYSLCEDCLDLAYEIAAGLTGEEMEDAIDACRDFEAIYPDALGFGDGQVSLRDVRDVVLLNKNGDRRLEEFARLAEEKGFKGVRHPDSEAAV